MANYSNVIVHLDAGHAESTPGKRSPYSAYGVEPKLDLYEWKWNRELVNILKPMLESKGFIVNIITPECKEDVKLTTRYKRANEVKEQHPDKKHIFISVHANAMGDGSEWNSARGWSAYTTKGQTNSDILAECMYDFAESTFKPMGMTVRTDKSDGDRDYEENFTVIYGANMPAVLTENFFYTNTKDTEFLLSDEGKKAIAEVHLKGIMKFCDKMNY